MYDLSWDIVMFTGRTVLTQVTSDILRHSTCPDHRVVLKPITSCLGSENLNIENQVRQVLCRNPDRDDVWLDPSPENKYL